MATTRVEKKLAAILAADVVGYSRLVGADQAGTIAQLNPLRKDFELSCATARSTQSRAQPPAICGIR